jgi:hypothetical protein
VSVEEGQAGYRVGRNSSNSSNSDSNSRKCPAQCVFHVCNATPAVALASGASAESDGLRLRLRQRRERHGVLLQVLMARATSLQQVMEASAVLSFSLHSTAV